MSGIAGVLQFGGRPVDPELVQSMTDGIRHRGQDAGGCWCDGEVALGHRLMHTAPGVVPEPQPLVDRARGLSVVLDGRIDNRDELAGALGIERADLPGTSDAQLVARAYERWSQEAPSRILGDFAFAIWDARARELFCARDIVGVRPFHYALDAHGFLFGSELQQVLRARHDPVRLDEGMIGEFLAVAVASTEDTLFVGLRRLAPGHWLRVGVDGRLRTSRYWSLDFAARTRYPRVDDYAQHLLELLSACVASRLPSGGMVGYDLSGGLDSSTVSSLGHAQVTARSGRDRAFAVVFPGEPCDESGFIADVAQHSGVDVERLPNCPVEPEHFEALAERFLDVPGYPGTNAFVETVAPALRRHHCRVMLSGQGGDERFIIHHEYLADLLLAGRWREIHRGVGSAAEEESIPLRLAFLRYAVRPWLRRTSLLSGLFRRREVRMPWLRSDWVARVGLLDRVIQRPTVGHGASCAQAANYEWAFAGDLVHGHEVGDRLTALAGIDYRHPLLDRRLIEFVASIPQELRRCDGIDKGLLRRAMRGRLPTSILERRTKAQFSHLFVPMLERVLARRPLADWTAVRNGWVDADVLAASFRQAREGQGVSSGAGAALWSIWMAYAVGLAIDAATGGESP